MRDEKWAVELKDAASDSLPSIFKIAKAASGDKDAIFYVNNMINSITKMQLNAAKFETLRIKFSHKVGKKA